MNKELTPLEALERLYIAGNLELKYVYDGKQKEDYIIVETSLKALEIIKKHLVVGFDEEAKLLTIYAKIDDKTLRVIYATHNKEEYELLKEVLL